MCLGEPPTIPNDPDGEQRFTIAHPFHPLYGQAFLLLAQRWAWGESRVFFPDPQTHAVRSLPVAWTSLATPDPFRVIAGDRTLLRFQDLLHLDQMLPQGSIHQQEEQ